MLTFFRRIRKSLLGSGTTRKYILYAVGEIALVVIGILIALQVNNWNAYRKANKLEQSYLKRLKTDLMADSAYLHQRILLSESVKKRNYSFVHEAHKNLNSERNLKEYISIPMFLSQDLTIQNTTYIELLNTGKIDLIRNERLKI